MTVRLTSIEAYNQIKENGLLSMRRWQVFDSLTAVWPATGGEVFAEMKRRYGVLIPSNSNTITRLGELRELGIVEELGTRKCTVTGQNVILWGIVPGLPIKPTKPRKIKCAACSGRGYHLQESLF